MTQLPSSNPLMSFGSSDLTANSQKKSVPNRIASEIQTLITEQGLEFGDQLPSQRDLAKQLDCSRSSVREGIAMLEILGRLDVRVGRGVFVAQKEHEMSAESQAQGFPYSVLQVYQFRMAIEPFGLKLAFENLTPNDLADLRRYTVNISEAVPIGDIVAAAANDTKFHDLIFQRCNNQLITDVYFHLRKSVQMSQWLPMVHFSRVAETGDEHMAIIEALEAGQIDEACVKLERHIICSAERCGIEL